MFRFVFAVSLSCLLAGSVSAGKFNKTLSIGDTAPSWENLEGTDGKKHSLADLKDKDAIVVVFTCNSCPVAEGYEARIIAFAKAHADMVAVVAINVNTGKEDALPAMTQRAAKKKFPYPYLFDPSQQTARKYGAAFTPEFIVLDKNRKVAYLGAFDDKSNAAAVKVKYLEDAVSAVRAGKPAPIAETSAAAGCRIKFTKKTTDE